MARPAEIAAVRSDSKIGQPMPGLPDHLTDELFSEVR